MAELLLGINGEIIRWAREYYNMQPEEAATAIGVDLERYSNWESGRESPSYAKLKKISEVFRKPSAVFFFPEPPELPTIKGDLRTLSDEIITRFSKNIIVQFERAKVYQMSVKELYPERESILANRNSFPTDTLELCTYLRGLLGFAISAQKARKNTKVVFEIYRERFYDLGIYVFKDSFRDNSVSGLCINDATHPVIMINNSMSFARQVFTLFHELYHLISDTSGAEIIRDDFYAALEPTQEQSERACDVFANAFLIPHDDFLKELTKQPLTEEYIEHLAKLYSVSREAIMYTLLKMGRITSADYNELKEIFYGEAIRNQKQPGCTSKAGGNYYTTKLSYLGQQYTRDVFKRYFSGQIDSIHASEMLHSKVDHLPQLESAFFRGVG